MITVSAFNLTSRLHRLAEMRDRIKTMIQALDLKSASMSIQVDRLDRLGGHDHLTLNIEADSPTLDAVDSLLRRLAVESTATALRAIDASLADEMNRVVLQTTKILQDAEENS